MASTKQALGIQEVSPSALGLNGWLQYVAKQYLSHTTLELIKFSFRAEISKAELEKTHCLLELFYLIKDIYNGNEAEALSRLVYTLNLMGHQRFGYKSVRKLEKYGFSKPPEHNPIWDTRGAQLFQCLAKIACHLSDDDEYRTRCYWARVLGINKESPSMETILAVLSMIVERRKITEEDQLELANGLNSIGAYKCIKYLIEYRKRNKLSVKEYEDKINPDYKSTGSSKTYSSKYSIQSESPTRGTPVAYETAPEGSPTPVKMPQTHLSPVIKRYFDSMSEDDDSETEVLTIKSRSRSGEHLPLLPQLPQIRIDQSVGKGVRLLVVSLFVFAVLVMVGIAGSTYGTIHAATYQPDNQEQQLLFEQSLVLLADHLHPYYLASVDLTQLLREYPHNIDLYLIDSESKLLNKTTTIEPQKQLVEQQSIENHTMYLLQGSVIDYSIRAITNYSQRVIVEIHVLDNLEAVWNSLQDSKELLDAWKSFDACHEDQSKPCLPLSVVYNVTKSGYYSVRFTLNNPSAFYSMKYDYNMTITNVSYELPSPKAVVRSCTLTDIEQEHKQHCIFTMNESSYHEFWHMNDEMCLLANVHKANLLDSDWSEKKAFTQVDTSCSIYNVNWLIVCVCVLVVLAVLISSVLLLEGIVCYRLYKRCKSNN